MSNANKVSDKLNGALASFAVLLGFLLTGEAISWSLKRLGFPIPGNVIEMVAAGI